MRELTALSLDELDAQPFRLTMRAKLDADPLAVFGELADPSIWFPLMRRSVWKSGATSGVGALREVDMIGFGRFRERMLAWDHGERPRVTDRSGPSEYWGRIAFTMIGTTSPLIDRMAEDFRVTGDGLEWTVAATPSRAGRFVTPALRPILRVMFARAAANLQKRVASYKPDPSSGVPRHLAKQRRA